jgi:hypothetical protein
MTASPNESSPAAADEPPVASSRSSPPRALASGGQLFLLRLPERPLLLPSECPCCGQPPSLEMRASHRAGPELLIGYCDACARHVAASTTKRLAFTLAAVLLAIALAAALPIALPWQSNVVCSVLAFFGALLPLLAISVRWRPKPGHAAHGPAVAFRSASELACHRQEFAERVAALANTPVRSVTERRFDVRPSSFFILALAVALALWSHAYHHPEVRILNLTDAPLVVSADGHELGHVEPSSGESPLAGRDVRIPAGFRRLKAVDVDGLLVADTGADVVAGRRHLYAPASPQICFWLETVAYGREPGPGDFEPLVSAERFFVLPEGVQGWFMPSAPAASGSRATGGSATALRQRPCDEGAPTN